MPAPNVLDTIVDQIKNGHVPVPSRPAPKARIFTVTGIGPGGKQVSFKQRGTDAGDAIWHAKKRAALTGWSAK